MKLTSLITAILMFLTLPVLADFDTASRAYEVGASYVTVPTSDNSDISCSECEDCDRVTARLTPQTHYTLNGQNVRFAEFREAILQAKQTEQSGVVILHHLESDTVVSAAVILIQ